MSTMKSFLEEVSTELGFEGEINDKVVVEGRKRIMFEEYWKATLTTQLHPIINGNLTLLMELKPLFKATWLQSVSHYE